MVRIEQLDHVALTVSDLDRSVAWYRDVLGLERRRQDVWGRYPAMMCAGNTGVALFPSDKPGDTPDAVRGRAMRHLAFRTNGMAFTEAQRELGSRNIVFTFEDHTISRSIYFRDPDGYEIELTTYEVD